MKYLANVLKETVGPAAIVAVQDPVWLDDFTEPLPDIALLRPRADYYRNGHPGPGDVIEVADTSLAYDGDVKLPRYARSDRRAGLDKRQAKGLDFIGIGELATAIGVDPRPGPMEIETHRLSPGMPHRLSACHPSDAAAQGNGNASMPDLPHRFECLTARRADPIVFIGAGLSYGLVPSPADLHRDCAVAAEKALGCHGAIPPMTDDDALYRWAHAVLQHCDDTDPRPPKLRLAEALGILSEPRWLGKQGLPLRGTTPRHRVIARLAREGRWAAIWHS